MNVSYSTGNISKRKQWFLLFSGLLLLGLLLGVSLGYERHRITEEQFARLASKAQVVDQNIVRQLQGVDETLKSALSDFDAFVQTQPAVQAGTDANPYLSALANTSLGLRTIQVLDASGRVLGSSRDGLVGMDFSGREYFRTPSQFPAPDVLYLSQPFKTLLGVYSMNLVRVATDANGQMLRMASATLDPAFFQVLLSSVIFDSDVWVALAHIDGSLVLQFPERPDLLGSNLRRQGSFFSRHVESGSAATVLAGRVGTTGNQAWMAQRTINPSGLNMTNALVVAVARDPSVALRPWRNLVAVGVLLWGIVAMVSVTALAFFQKYQAKEERLLSAADALRRKAEEEVRVLAFYDPLTALPNRRLLFDRMTQLQASSLRHKRYSALLFLDLDGFKKLNDTLGHDQGDRLLQQVAQRLSAQIRQEDTAARWAGDEFAVVLSDLSSDEVEASQRAEKVARKILDALAYEYLLAGQPFSCTASLGITLFGRQSESLDAVLKRADEAMYEAKSAGRNTYRLKVVATVRANAVGLTI